MNSKILTSLLNQTWQSPVFGDSFGVNVSLKTPKVALQVQEVMQTFTKDLAQKLAIGMPGASEQEVQKVVMQIAPKTVSFCPALAAGELHDVSKLSAFSVAIGLMYWGDQTMDRGDASMPYAIRLFAKQEVGIPKSLATKAAAQAKALAGIEEKIAFFARPEDVPFVLACFREQVLLNEVRVQDLSKQYLATTSKDAFLTKHGKELANLITIDAGFPSVSSSLYALYRQQDPTLPPLAEVYANKTMNELLQVCNVVVRILDELGDWDMDAGNHPEWGVFTLNPFNQPNERFVGELLQLGSLSPNLYATFKHFHDSPEMRLQLSATVVKTMTDHIKQFVGGLPPEQFKQYVILCKRVIEIGYVNRVGDINLAKE